MPMSIRFSPDVEARLDNLARETGRAKSFYIKKIVEENLDAIEECYLAESVLERIRAEREKVHNSASVRKELGLAD